MRIHGDSFHDAVGIAKHYIRCLSRDPGQFQNLLHCLGYFSAEFFFYYFRGGYNIFRLCSVKSRGLYFLFKYFLLGLGKIVHRLIFLKKIFGNLVYFFVSALSRQNNSYQELYIIPKLQSHLGVGKCLIKTRKNFLSALLFLLKRFHDYSSFSASLGKFSSTPETPPCSPSTQSHSSSGWPSLAHPEVLQTPGMSATPPHP